MALRDWNQILEVGVTEEKYAYSVIKPCPWIGHHSYRCGNCMTHFVKVRSKDDHDASCHGCGWELVVRARQNTPK